MYRVTPHCYAINFEDIPSCFVLNVCLWLFSIIKWFKQGSSLDNTNIWGTFWSKYGYLTPWGAHISGYPPLFCHLFWRNSITIRVKCDIFDISYLWKVRNVKKRLFWLFFGRKLGVWPPGVTIRAVTPWDGHNFFQHFQPYFRENVGLGWLFMFKFTKMVINCQNMVKTWNFKFFRHFGTPQGVN